MHVCACCGHIVSVHPCKASPATPTRCNFRFVDYVCVIFLRKLRDLNEDVLY